MVLKDYAVYSLFIDILADCHAYEGLETRGRILGRNWGKSLQSFSPCYSHSPLITDFTPPPPLSKSGLKLVCNVNIV